MLTLIALISTPSSLKFSVRSKDIYVRTSTVRRFVGLYKVEFSFLDGFSPFPSILTYFADLSGSNLPPHWDVGRSLLPSSPTVLLHAETGETVASMYPTLRIGKDLSQEQRELS